jgi:ubiquinone/menaquinone biosynthesis C-methylase UbiE
MKSDSAIKETVSTKDKYDRVARWYDIFEFVIELFFFSRWRRRFFKLLRSGDFLELGVGTGKNLRFYPTGVKKTAVDFSPNMLKYAKRRAAKMQKNVDLETMDIQHLQIASDTFPNVLATFVFCSVPDPIKGLEEAKRICTSEGRLLLLEHVKPKSRLLGRLFDWINPIVVNYTGVNINRNTVENIKRAGFEVVREENLFLDIFKLIVAKPRRS